MKKFWIVMGQGLTGNLSEIAVCTGTLYSCSAVAFYNDETGIGGLYHYPCGGLKHEEVEESLGGIAFVTKATSVRVMRAQINELGGTPGEDIVDLKRFFATKNLVLKMENDRGTWAGIAKTDDGLKFYNRTGGDWPRGNILDYQARQAGKYIEGNVKVTLWGKSGEDERVNPTG